MLGSLAPLTIVTEKAEIELRIKLRVLAITLKLLVSNLIDTSTTQLNPDELAPPIHTAGTIMTCYRYGYGAPITEPLTQPRGASNARMSGTEDVKPQCGYSKVTRKVANPLHPRAYGASDQRKHAEKALLHLGQLWTDRYTASEVTTILVRVCSCMSARKRVYVVVCCTLVHCLELPVDFKLLQEPQVALVPARKEPGSMVGSVWSLPSARSF